LFIAVWIFYIFAEKRYYGEFEFHSKTINRGSVWNGDGYFLDFSNREFNEFMKDVVDYSIMLPKFWTAGQTKKVNFAA